MAKAKAMKPVQFEYYVVAPRGSRGIAEVHDWLLDYDRDHWLIAYRPAQKMLPPPISKIIVTIFDKRLDLLFALRWGNWCINEEAWHGKKKL